MPGVDQQTRALFEDGWDFRDVVLVERIPPAAGKAGSPATPYARFVEDRENRVVVEAAAGAGGGYLLLLDSYADDWRVTVDGGTATMVRANGLFRAVLLAEGRHVVEFDYRPRALVLGASVSGVALLTLVGLSIGGRRQSREASTAEARLDITRAASAGPR